MNKTIALREFNKRASVKLDSKEFDLIEGMKSFDKEKVMNAFIALTGREIGQEDIKLAILIIELSEALTPPTLMIRDPNLGGSPSIPWPRSPQPYTQRYGDGIMCGSRSALDSVGSAVDL